MTIVEVDRMGLTHLGFRRVLIQCAVLDEMSLCIASSARRQCFKTNKIHDSCVSSGFNTGKVSLKRSCSNLE